MVFNSAGDVNSMPIEEADGLFRKSRNVVSVLGIFAANWGPISVKKSLNLLAIIFFSLISRLSMKKLSGREENSFPCRSDLITPHVLLRSFSHSRILFA